MENAIVQYMQYFMTTFAPVKIPAYLRSTLCAIHQAVGFWYGLARGTREQMYATVNQLKRRSGMDKERR